MSWKSLTILLIPSSFNLAPTSTLMSSLNLQHLMVYPLLFHILLFIASLYIASILAIGADTIPPIGNPFFCLATKSPIDTYVFSISNLTYSTTSSTVITCAYRLLVTVTLLLSIILSPALSDILLVTSITGLLTNPLILSAI